MSNLFHRAALALALILPFYFLPAHAAQAPGFKLRHAGTLFKAWIAPDASSARVCEDGGRLRGRDASGTWSFVNTNVDARDLFLGVSALDNGSTGWAVGLNGRYNFLSSHGYAFPDASSPEELWGVAFADASRGWMISAHNVYYSHVTPPASAGGSASSWVPATLRDQQGNVMGPAELANLKLLSIDIVRADQVAPLPQPLQGFNVVGLITAQPGYIFRNIDPDGTDWQIVYSVYGNFCVGATNEVPACIAGACPPNPPTPFGVSLYGVAISRNPDDPLALVVGGLGAECGLIFSSQDYTHFVSERHECCQTDVNACDDCASSPAHAPVNPPSAATFRHSKFKELYAVSIFDTDNTAIASGYAGQILRRSTDGVWYDESRFSNDLINAPTAVITPLYGAAADAGSAGTGTGLVVGTGGRVLLTTTGGVSTPTVPGWVDQPAPGTTNITASHWRIWDVHFIDDQRGFVVGQWFRIGRSTDGGETWGETVTPPPVTNGRNLLAITFDDGGQIGVAVGQSPSGGTGKPKILFAPQQTIVGKDWLAPNSVIEVRDTNSIDMELRAVDWAGGTDFWAAGQAGLIYRSTDGGQNWQQFVPNGQSWTTFSNFEIQGVAFGDLTTGVFVGSIGNQGKAFLYQDFGGGSISWSDISLALPPEIKRINDVAIATGGGVVWAVATKQLSNGVEKGVLLSGDLMGSPLTEVAEVDACTVGDNLANVPVLNRVAVAPGGKVWVGGRCGRVWRHEPGSGILEDFKSQTDAHVRGISFTGEDDGFFVCFRAGYAAWSIVKYGL